jgi:hypothetical protein
MQMQHNSCGHGGKVAPPKGTAGSLAWVLDDDARSVRLRSLLIPVCVMTTVVLVAALVAITLVLHQGWPAALGVGAAGTVGAGLAGKRWLTRRSAKTIRPAKKN